jgi:hypothetical protein
MKDPNISVDEDGVIHKAVNGVFKSEDDGEYPFNRKHLKKVPLLLNGEIVWRRYKTDEEGCMPCMDIQLKPGERLLEKENINDKYYSIEFDAEEARKYYETHPQEKPKEKQVKESLTKKVLKKLKF